MTASQWPVPAALDGERVDRALALITGLSRRQVDEMVAGGRVRLGSRNVGSRHQRVHEGQILSVEGEIAVREVGLQPDATVAVPVIHEDEDLLVVDKPAGMVVHPGAGQRSQTMIAGLLSRYPDLEALASGDQADRPGVVHRLDRGTSGLLVVARNHETLLSLQAQLAERSMGREYVALVAGTMEADEGLVDAPLGRSDTDPSRIRVQTGGRPARTRYSVEQRFTRPAPATLLGCRLETGRTHQIRVHLASIGHPVVGDDRYGGRTQALRELTVRLPTDRPFLHAAVLTFRHPRSSEVLTFRSELPGDLRAALAGIT